MREINADALDRFITGNYGEDRHGPVMDICHECGSDAYENDDGLAECESCEEVFSPYTDEDYEYEKADRERDERLIEGD